MIYLPFSGAVLLFYPLEYLQNEMNERPCDGANGQCKRFSDKETLDMEPVVVIVADHKEDFRTIIF